jgi:hypothetical protein
MAAPVNVPISVEQIAQDKAQDPSRQANKLGSSRFDEVMADKAGPAEAPPDADIASEVQRVQAAQQTEQVQKLDGTRLNKIHPLVGHSSSTTSTAVPSVTAASSSGRAVTVISHMVGEIEKGQGMLDKLINGGLHGARFNNTELLALQAGMYKYTEELDLTSKVVEKATSGLKDTLKTQV